jgi:hypothetical protein
MSLSPETQKMVEEMRARRTAAEQSMRAEFFASREAIPDLDLMPDCSICGGSLEYDECFVCDGCNVRWERNGTEGKAFCLHCGDDLPCSATCVGRRQPEEARGGH